MHEVLKAQQSTTQNLEEQFKRANETQEFQTEAMQDMANANFQRKFDHILYYINLFNVYKHLCIYTCSNLQLHLIYVYDRIPLNPKVVHKCVG